MFEGGGEQGGGTGWRGDRVKGKGGGGTGCGGQGGGDRVGGRRPGEKSVGGVWDSRKEEAGSRRKREKLLNIAQHFVIEKHAKRQEPTTASTAHKKF